MTANRGMVSESWRKWFINVGKLTDPEQTTYIEAVTGATNNNFAAFNSVGKLKDSGKSDDSYADAVHYHPKLDYRIVTNDTVLTSADFGRLVIANNGAADLRITAPSVDGAYIGSILNCVRTGSGRLIMAPADSDIIENGSAGGFIMCHESGRAAANLKLVLVSQSLWAIIGGFGIWENF